MDYKLRVENFIADNKLELMRNIFKSKSIKSVLAIVSIGILIITLSLSFHFVLIKNHYQITRKTKITLDYTIITEINVDVLVPYFNSLSAKDQLLAAKNPNFEFLLKALMNSNLVEIDLSNELQPKLKSKI
jgi:hypothetical protein